MGDAGTHASGPSPVPIGWLLGVDWSACDGRGWCVELLPEVLVRDRWGYPLSHEDAERAAAAPDGAPRRPSREIAVPDTLSGHAQRAVDTCPRLALRLHRAS